MDLPGHPSSLVRPGPRPQFSSRNWASRCPITCPDPKENTGKAQGLPFIGRGLAHFSARFGPKKVPVPFGPRGQSHFRWLRRENRDSPRERLQARVKMRESDNMRRAVLPRQSVGGVGTCVTGHPEYVRSYVCQRQTQNFAAQPLRL